MRQRNHPLSLPEGEGRGEGDMEIPPLPSSGIQSAVLIAATIVWWLNCVPTLERV